jgi:hypothetical protein
MSIAAGWLGALVLLAAQDIAPAAARPPSAAEGPAVRTVLSRQAYPWYDGQSDRVVPVLPDPSSWQRQAGEWVESFFKWLDRLFGRVGRSLPGGGVSGLGNALATILLLASGALLLAVLWRLWRQYEPRDAARTELTEHAGVAARIAGLPAGTSLEGTDPWAEALRRRASGDRAGAVVWLFLGQLLALQKMGLVRPTPGRTARQYVTALDDPRIRDDMGATLGVFEDVYYGHRVPSPEALDSVWTRAEALRRRLSATERRP